MCQHQPFKLSVIKKPILMQSHERKDDAELMVLIISSGITAIYSQDEETFGYVAKTMDELNLRMGERNMYFVEIPEEQVRVCSNKKCEKFMQEGYYFETSGSTFCSETCLETEISMEEYAYFYTEDGSCYWTDWYDC